MSMLNSRLVLTSGILWKIPTRTVAIASNVTETTYVKPRKEIPGPSSLPIIGSLLHFLPGGSLYNRPDLAMDLYKRHGPIVQLKSPLAPPVVLLYDAAAVEEVYRQEMNQPMRPGQNAIRHYRRYYSKMSKMDGNYLGIAISNYEPWRNLRTLLNPILMKPAAILNYSNKVDEVAQDFIQRIRFFRDENNMVPSFVGEMKLYVFESSSSMTMGKRLNCLDFRKRFEDDTTESKAIKSINELFNLLDILDATPEIFWKYIPNKKFRRFIHLMDGLEEIVKGYIEIGKEEIKQGNKTDDELGIMHKIIEIDEDMAEVVMTEVLLGGTEAVSRALLVVLYHLAIYPEVQQKLRQQQNTSEGKSYLRAVIKETFRLLPNNSQNARITSKEYDVLGYSIPKGTSVVFNNEHLLLNEKNYHRPTEYIPERWLLESKDDPLSYKNANPFGYLPFGFGIRICIGMRIAKLQMETTLEHLIQNFNIGWQGPPIKFIKHYTLNEVKDTHFVLKDL